MNADIKVLTRLLLAVLLISLLSTVFLGNRIHKRMVESLEKRPYKVRTPHEHNTKIPLWSITIAESVLSHTDLDILKVQRNGSFILPLPKGHRKDWHDYEAMKEDSLRIGLGEQGKPAELTDPMDDPAKKEIQDQHGFNGLLSDRISLNRSLPDARPERCKDRKYLKKLPNVSVIIVFHNEHLSVLLRSIHSIVDRSPVDLLEEVILVDDASTFKNLTKNLDNYLNKNFPNITKVVRFQTRQGLIKARLRGAGMAAGRVLVFLDSHIEVGYTWLPPLLEPIAIHPYIVTSPILDSISSTTLAYEFDKEVFRLGFDWGLQLKHLPPIGGDIGDGSNPYRTPLLMGAVVIEKTFFWGLGGFDDELDIWGGEQFELSFKVWMCGGMLLHVPCSRIGHITRGAMLPKDRPRKYNFIIRNYKRVAEIWMDDYKKYVYERNPKVFKYASTGNLKRLRTLREELRCKSFDWYMHNVAEDVLLKFPPVEPPPLSSGSIRSVGYPELCIDAQNRYGYAPLVLTRCTGNSTHPGVRQHWDLTSKHEIRLNRTNDCMEIQGTKKNVAVWLYPCHSLEGNQLWHYHEKMQWLQLGPIFICLEAVRSKGMSKGQGRIDLRACKKYNKRQKWIFSDSVLKNLVTKTNN
ncbi:putative polypeptide N-acetylgalactosaminyltransferase 10 [Drosophila bipectinata]|uniref:putative polypeptide N-acetylgalactosaminyltransferase 10 n=1 Tax=Drosophila bipectinata TaxID=42026 RepID=UPI001C88EFA5|nr:putative polypeptide N-acetylgalactosaminyltransferase 10 [Drosophila bipectinata]